MGETRRGFLKGAAMLAADQVQQYCEEGWVLVPGAADASALAALNKQLDAWIEESRGQTGNYGRLPDGKARFDVEPDHTAEAPRLRRIGNPVDISDVYREFLWDGPFPDMAVDLYGPDIRCEYSRINVKAPGSGFKVYFHQDHPFEPHTNPDVVVTLFFLSDMTEENGCLCVVPGSHRERYSHWQDGKFTGTAAPDKQDDFWARAIPVTGTAGDVLLMDTWMLHASRVNQSTGDRRMLICDYAAADSIARGPMKIPTDVGPKIVRGQDTRTVRLCGETLEMPENYTEDTFFILQEEKMAAAE